MIRKIALLVMLAAAGVASAQTYTPTPPTNIPATMPAPVLTMTAGKTLTLSSDPVTQDVNGNALPAGQQLYYDWWEVAAGAPPVLIASGLTSPQRVHANMAAGTWCYVETATLTQAVGAPQPYATSDGSSPPVCVQVNAAPVTVKPAAPTNASASSL